MTKSVRKRARETVSAKKAKKTRKTARDQTKAAEYVGHLLELHKLQGTLLTQLARKV